MNIIFCISRFGIRFLLKRGFLLYLFFISFQASGQREKYFRQFPPSYFDSIRVLINDTSQEYYTIKAYRLGEEDQIHIDGKLDEPVWLKAEHKGNLLEKEPFPLIPMSEETEFAILYDDQNLYIGVWCWDSEPARIIQQLAPRGTSAPDHLMLFIDSYHDHRTGYKFVVSPRGVQGDELRYDDIKRDDNWNGIWYSEGSVDEKGWYAEVKIPFYNFRYSREKDQTWGFNIMRNISRNASRGQWKPHLPEWDNTTRMSQMGHIENISNIHSGRTFEIRPYGVTGSSKTFTHAPIQSYSFGGDIRYNPTPNFTADITFNPDFAQVDADVFEINLTKFPTRFRELRPFFTERSNVFNTPLELFYSRRIGAQGDILGGAKITGKIRNGIEFGFLGNLTGESLFLSSAENIEKALFSVMRVKKDVFGSSSLGILAATKENVPNFNRVYGLDGNFMLKHGHIFDFQVASGQTELQRKQNMAYLISYVKTGDLMGFQLNFNRAEPEFEINRVGYIQKEPGRGWNQWNGLLRISPRINKYGIRRITSNLQYATGVDLYSSRYINSWLSMKPEISPDPRFGSITYNNMGLRIITQGEREVDIYRASGDITINLINEMSVSSELNYFTASELTGSYSGNLIKINYSTRPVSLGTKFAGILSATEGTLYNYNQNYVGSHKSIALNGEGRFFRNLITKLQGEYTFTYDPEDVADGRYLKLSSNTILMFTKDFYFRVHAQGRLGTTYYQEQSIYNDYLLSCLLSWEYRPGSFLYLAYNEARFENLNRFKIKNMELKNRILVLKLSYFFSI